MTTLATGMAIVLTAGAVAGALVARPNPRHRRLAETAATLIMAAAALAVIALALRTTSNL